VDDYPLLELFWTILIIYAFIFYLVVLFRVVGDLFRDRASSGWAKTGWLILLLILPILGVAIYLVARGSAMAEREHAAAAANKESFDGYVRSVAGSGADPAAQIASAKSLLDSGAITSEEYEALKRKALG
jgi:hypothetical protein